MAFKKIDADCVNEENPLDAFTLQGVALNLKEARDNRIRRASMAWPVDSQPVLSAHPHTVVYPLCVWPGSPRNTQITVSIRHTVSDAPVSLGLGLIRSGTISISQSDLTSVSVGSTTTTLTLDVGFSEASVFLVVLSDLAGDEETTTLTQAILSNWDFLWPPGADGPGGQLNRLMLPDSHGLTRFDNVGDRWVIYFKPQSSGYSPANPQDLFTKRQIVRISEEDPGDRYTMWFVSKYSRRLVDEMVYIAGGGEDTEDYTLTFAVQTIGKTTVSGISIRESGIESFEDLKGRFLPARAPVARNIRTMYHQAREIATRHTRIHHIGPTWDSANTSSFTPPTLSSTVISVWGEGPATPTTGGGYKPMATAWVGNYPRNNIDGGTSRYRNRLRVAGLMVVATPDGEDLGLVLNVRASLYSWGGTAWDDDTTSGTAVAHPVVGVAGRRGGVPDTGYLLHYGNDSNPPQHLFHFLRGGILGTELGDKEIVYFSVEVSDDQTTVGDRQLRAEVGINSPGSLTGTVKVYCRTLTVWEEEGSYGT